MTASIETWHKSACILCENNCGIQIQTEGRRFATIRGDKDHVATAGYTCTKALRLDHYQNGGARLTTRLRREPDGTFTPIDWDTVVPEIAARLKTVRDTRGGESRRAGQPPRRRLQRRPAGRPRRPLPLQPPSPRRRPARDTSTPTSPADTRGDFTSAEVSLFLGKNPWQSHGVPRARTVLKDIAKDPARTMIVVDPVRTETVDLADIHVQVKSGTDAWCLAGLPRRPGPRGPPRPRLPRRPRHRSRHRRRRAQGGGRRRLRADLRCGPGYAAPDGPRHRRRLQRLDVRGPGRPAGSQQHAGVLLQQVDLAADRELRQARRHAAALVDRPAGSLLHQPAPHTVTGARMPGGLVPCSVIAEEILTDHPDRFHAMIIESSNPAHSLADFATFNPGTCRPRSGRRHRHRPGRDRPPGRLRSSRRLAVREVGGDLLHLRVPPQHLPPAGPGPRPAARHSARTRDLRPPRQRTGRRPSRQTHLRTAARLGRTPYKLAFAALAVLDKSTLAKAPHLLYETLGLTLPDGACSAAVLWALAQRIAKEYPAAMRRAGHRNADACSTRCWRDGPGSPSPRTSTTPDGKTAVETWTPERNGGWSWGWSRRVSNAEVERVVS